MTVELSGSHEAVIFVECNVYAQINNHGRAIIDMQSGSGFYFLVPWVAVGNYHCHNPGSILKLYQWARVPPPKTDFDMEMAM